MLEECWFPWGKNPLVSLSPRDGYLFRRIYALSLPQRKVCCTTTTAACSKAFPTSTGSCLFHDKRYHACSPTLSSLMILNQA